MDCVGFVLSIRSQSAINDLEYFEDKYDFITLDKNHEQFSNKNKKNCY